MPHSIWPVCALCGRIVPPSDLEECELKDGDLTADEKAARDVRVAEAIAEGRPILLNEKEA